MGNRRKLKGTLGRHRKTVRPSALEKIEIPTDDKVVIHRVPAKIPWAEVEGIDRDDVEIIGETVIYEDHSFDVILNPDISDDAVKLINGADDSINYRYSVSDGSS